MHLESLTLVNFKNYETAEIQFHKRINGIYGNNGQGKTNLLDAVYYLSFCKSFFNPIDVQNIKTDLDFFVLQGNFVENTDELKVHCGVKKGYNRVFKKNNKEYEKLADHIGTVPLVMISPADTDLVHEGSEVRRKFTDGIISQFDRKYLDNLQNYQRVVKQRNAVLKHFYENRRWDPEMLSIYNEQLEQYGEPVYRERIAFLDEFRPLFVHYFQWLTGSEEIPGIVYNSSLSDTSWKDGFEQTAGKDRAVQYTNFGVHKDDLEFLLDGKPLKRFGSQGQQKTYVIALKLAQFHSIRQRLGTIPILLLDDIFDKIDDRRVAKLMELINGDEFGQVLITDTERSRLETILNRISSEHLLIEISKGQVSL
ncbi:MAG: DNA replication and repair protein RecF [Bacteroidota bacterium]